MIDAFDGRMSRWGYQTRVAAFVLMACLAVPAAVVATTLGSVEWRLSLAGGAVAASMMAAMALLMLQSPERWMRPDRARFAWWIPGAVWMGSFVAAMALTLALYTRGVEALLSVFAGLAVAELLPGAVGPG